MITFLSSPKSFGAANDRSNQYRAVQSWLSAAPSAEVILYGNSSGIEQAGRDLGVRVVKDVQCAPSGIPYFGAITEHAAQKGKYDLQVYANCDILLCGISSALTRIELPQFLMVGERIDLGEGVFVDTRRRGWKGELLKPGNARLHGPAGKDYFGFRRGLWRGLPPVVTGRGWYDNALLAFCIRKRVPIVDATPSVVALHQFHDYGHIAGGNVAVRYGPDSVGNVKVTSGRRSPPLVSDADLVLENNLVRRWPCRGDQLRRLELLCRYTYGYPRLGLTLRILWRVRAALGLSKAPSFTLEELLAQDFGEASPSMEIAKAGGMN